ncbi:MAG: NADH-quinone oxidoreductase subunit J [Legionellales bacterium]|nr:NADH-quinone oxidoreductase subunit J [Legionellales bacterium]
MLLNVLFFIFAFIVVGCSLMVILTKNPVQCALFLVITFIACAGVWLLAGAEFLALVLILVYVGAVMTMFLFVVMMISIEQGNNLKNKLWKYFLLSMLMVGAMAYCMYLGIKETKLVGRTVLDREIIDNISAVGMKLYTEFGYSFVIAGILLLTAIVASIALIYRNPQNRKVQDIKKQMQTNKSDRLKLVDL